MPQNEEVGMAMHDYDAGDSDPISTVVVVDDDEVTNDTGKVSHRVVISA